MLPAIPSSRADWPPTPAWMADAEQDHANGEEEDAQEEPETAIGPPPDIPERWLERGRGLREALEIQEATGADMLVYISSRDPPGPANRSSYFERRVLRSREFDAAIRDYIRVKLIIPGDRDSNEFAERHRVRFGPRLLILRPGGFAISIGPYTRDEHDQFILGEEDEILRLIRARSSPRHQEQEPVEE